MNTYFDTKVTAKLISAFVFATQIVHFLFYLNPKFQASSSVLCGTGWFVSDLFGNHIVVFPTKWLRLCEPHFENFYNSLIHGGLIPNLAFSRDEIFDGQVLSLLYYNKVTVCSAELTTFHEPSHDFEKMT